MSVDRDHGHIVPTLFDEAPDGSLTPITRGFLNLAYRDSLAKGVPMPAGKPTRAVVSLLPQDWIVRKDHRLVVGRQLQRRVGGAGRAGLGVTVLHGGASRLLLPLVGFGIDPVTSLPAVPGGRRPLDPLLTRLQVRKALRVKLVRRDHRRLRAVHPRAQRRPGRREAAARPQARRPALRRRAHGARHHDLQGPPRGRYRAVVGVRSREGLVTKRSAAVRAR